MSTTRHVFREVNAGRMTVAEGMAQIDQAQQREAQLERFFAVLRWALVALACVALLVLLFAALPAAAHTPPLEQLPQTMLAQGDAAPAPAPVQGIGDKLLELASPGTVGTVASLILGALGGLAFLTMRRKKLVALASYYAFHIVEDIGNEIDGEDGFDKTARYLQKVDEYMRANGWRPLKPGEVEVAKLQASALHGAEVAKAKVAVAAAEAAALAAAGP